MAFDMHAKLAGQVIQKAAQNSQAEVSKPSFGQGESSQFKEILDSTDQYQKVLDAMGMGKPQAPGEGSMGAISGNDITFNTDQMPHQKVEFKAGDKIVDMLTDFNKQQGQMDLLMSQILHGEKKFSNQELLAIQSHVFHVAQMTELTVKSVELAVSSFRGVMNTQIQ